MRPFLEAIHEPARLGDGPDRAVVVHGFPGTPAEMRAIGESLAGRGWRVDLPLLPGFGRDYGTLARIPWQRWRAAVTATLREEGRGARAQGGRLLGIGFSMGGALMLTSVADDGCEVDGLVLLAPFTRFVDLRARLLPLARHVVGTVRPYAGVDFGDPGVREEIGRKVGAVDLDDAEVRARLRRDVRLPVSALDELRRAGAHALRVAPRLRGVPTLVIQGRDDRTVTPRATRELVARLGVTPETRWLPGADHLFVLPGRPGHEETLTTLAAFAARVRGDWAPRLPSRRARDAGPRRSG